MLRFWLQTSPVVVKLTLDAQVTEGATLALEQTAKRGVVQESALYITRFLLVGCTIRR
jgi:hypothetical protein